MARDTLGYQYTGEGDSSRMPSGEIDDDNTIDRMGRIFKDMSAYTPCPVPGTPPRVHRTRSVAALSVGY
jgi:hypothetical protein